MSKYDVAGIGLGPANLSLAALLDDEDIGCCWLSNQSKFSWHDGFSVCDPVLQNSFLKDLVTLVDPTNRYSFVNYLKETGKIYSFIHADFPRVSRREFSHYMKWVSTNIRNIKFDAEVNHIAFFDNYFELHFSDRKLRAQNIVVGSGRVPLVPTWAKSASSRIRHCSEFDVIPALVEKYGGRVCIVGGGQSGAEVFSTLLNGTIDIEEVTWITRRSNFLPLDESPFTNELFRPSYIDSFRSMSGPERAASLSEQYLASNGISPSLLNKIYQQLYIAKYVDYSGIEVDLLVGFDVSNVAIANNGLVLQSIRGTSSKPCDIVILCTGWSLEFPSYLSGLRQRISFDNEYLCELSSTADFSVQWDGPPENRIFLQSFSSHSHGIADANLSGVAWRSGVIANALLGRPRFELSDSAFVNWASQSVKPPEKSTHGQAAVF